MKKTNVLIQNDNIDGVNIIDAVTGNVIINLASEDIAKEWLSEKYWEIRYNLVVGVAEFSWDWEAVAVDQVIIGVDWSHGYPSQYGSLTEYAQDYGLSSARKFAKKWAKENNFAFREVKMSDADMYDYRVAVLDASRNRV